MFRVDASPLSIKTHSNSIYPCQFEQVAHDVPKGYRLYKNSLINGHPIYLLQAEEKHMPVGQHDLSHLQLTRNCKLIIDMQVDRQDQLLLPSSGVAPYFVGDKSAIRSCELVARSHGSLVKVQWGGIYPPAAITEIAQKKQKTEAGAVGKSLVPAGSPLDTELKRKDIAKEPHGSAPKTMPQAARPSSAISRLPQISTPHAEPRPVPQPPKEKKAEIKAPAAKTPSLQIKKAAPDIRRLKNKEQRKLGTAALKKYLDLVTDEKAMEIEDHRRFGRKLKPHQSQSLLEILQTREKQEMVAGVFDKPTGSGKTIIMVSSGHITREKNVIISPANEIGQQTMDEVNAINSRLPKGEKLVVVDVLKAINEQSINDKAKSNEEKRRHLTKIFAEADFLTFTYQYLRGQSSLAELIPWDLVSVVNLDEAHECCSAKSKQFIDMLRKHGCHIHAYTASPYLFKSSDRIKKGGVNDVYQLLDLTPETNPFSKLDIRDTIDQGINCPMKIFHITVKEEKDEELTIAAGKGNDFREEDISNVINKEKFNLIVAHQYANGVDPVSQFPFRGQQFIVFCVDVKHCINITAQMSAALPIDKMDPEGRLRAQYAKRKVAYYKKTFPDKIINEEEIEEKAKKEFMVIGAFHSKMKKKESDEMYLKIKLGGVLLVANVDKLVRGCDFPRLAGIFALRPTQAETIKKQGPGRGLRIDPENPIKICYLFEFIWGETECIYYFQFLTRDGIPQAQWGVDRIEAFRKLQQPSQFEPITIPGVAEYKRHDDLKYENKRVVIGDKPIRYKSLQAVKAQKDKKAAASPKKMIELPADIKAALKTLVEGVDLLDLQFIKFKKEVTLVFEADEQMDGAPSASQLKRLPAKETKDENKTPPLDINTQQINTILNKAEKKLSQITSYIAPPAKRSFNPAPKKAEEKQNGKDEKVETLYEKLARLRKESKNLKEKISKLYFKAYRPDADSMNTDEINEAEEEKTLQNEIQRVAAEFKQILQEVEARPDAIKESIKAALEKAQEKPEEKSTKKTTRDTTLITEAQQIIDTCDANGKDINIYNLQELHDSRDIPNKHFYEPIAQILLQRKDKREKLARWRAQGRSILHYLAEFRHNTTSFFTIVDAIIDDKELPLDVNLQDAAGNTPLHLLVSQQHSFTWRKDREKRLYYLFKLVAKGAKLNIRNANGDTPITYAIRNNKHIFASALTGLGGKWDEKEQAGPSSMQTPRVHKINGFHDRTLLHEMVSFSRLDMLTAILPWFKGEMNVRDVDQRTPLHYVFGASMAKKRAGEDVYIVEQDLILDVTTTLIKHDAEVNVVDKYNCTPLHYACQKLERYLKAALVLLPHLKDEFVNLQDSIGQTLLHVFFRNPFLEPCQPLNRKQTATKQAAVKKEMEPLFNALMERKVDPNCVDNNGCTALYYALFHLNDASIDAVLQLVKAMGPAIKKDWVDSDGNSYLHLLCHYAKADAKKLIALASLIGSETQLNSYNAEKMTPLHLLMRSYRASLFPLVQYLFSMRLNVDYSHASNTPLHEFCDSQRVDSTGSAALFALFAQQKISFLQQDAHGRTAFEIAAARLTESSLGMMENLLHFSLTEAGSPVLNTKGQNALHLFILNYISALDKKLDSMVAPHNGGFVTNNQPAVIRMIELIQNYYHSQYRVNPLTAVDREGYTPLLLLFNRLNYNNTALAVKMVNDADPAAIADGALFHALFSGHTRLNILDRLQLFRILLSKIPSELMKTNQRGISGLARVIDFLEAQIRILFEQLPSIYDLTFSLEPVLLFKQELQTYENANPALFKKLNDDIASLQAKFALRNALPQQALPFAQTQPALTPPKKIATKPSKRPTHHLAYPATSTAPAPSVPLPAPIATEQPFASHSASQNPFRFFSGSSQAPRAPSIAEQSPMFAPPPLPGQPFGLAEQGFFAFPPAPNPQPFHFSMSAPAMVPEQPSPKSTQMSFDRGYPFASPDHDGHTPAFFSGSSSSSSQDAEFDPMLAINDLDL